MADDRKPITYRPTIDRYEWLRTQAFERRISMQKIIDEAIDELMNRRATPPPPTTLRPLPDDPTQL